MAFRTNKTPVLQEKTASGSVASFNTALAMPLVSCNIAVNAWQEGSGDSSPSNVRPIHGFSVVNATRAGKNLFKPEFEDTTRQGTDIRLTDDGRVLTSGVPSSILTFTIGTLYLTRGSYKLNGCPSGGGSGKYRLEVTDYPTTITLGQDNGKGVSFSITQAMTVLVRIQVFTGALSELEYKPMIRQASVVDDTFEPFVASTIYPIQLGQEVYGAEVDVVNGVAHCTHSIVDMGDLNYAYVSATAWNCFRAPINDKKQGETNIKCSSYQTRVFYNTSYDSSIQGYGANSNVFVRDTSFNGDYSAFKLAVTGQKIVYELATPLEISLSDIPTLSTIIGNNTIFADTGDVDLTYNDLDIAKRGSFREVFKLPS